MGTGSSRAESVQWDLNQLSQASGLSCPQIEEFYSDYVKASGRDGVMNMKKFFQLYSNLLTVQSESNSTKRDKANHIFRVFDRDHNGILSFDEFLNAIVMINYEMPKTMQISKVYALRIFRHLNDLPTSTEYRCWKEFDRNNRGYVTEEEELVEYIS